MTCIRGLATRCLALVSGISFLLALSTPAQRHAHPPDVSKVVKQDPQPPQPPAVIHREVDPAEPKRDAAALQKLAVTISEQVDQVTRNQLPKDLNDNLKRIEKLAKHLARQSHLDSCLIRAAAEGPARR